MNTSSPRKKQPGIVRERLLHAAADMAVERGLAAITLDAVARRAGVSKGGLLHHFPSRQALLEALFKSQLERLDAKLTAAMRGDAEPTGRFTRAYVAAVTTQDADGFGSGLLGSVALAMSMDPPLARLWSAWLEARLQDCGAEDASVMARIVRYAADGMWLEDCAGCTGVDPAARQEAVARLTAMTYTL